MPSCHGLRRSYALQEQHESAIQRIIGLDKACIAYEEERQLKDDVKAKSFLLTGAKKEFDEMCKVLADLEVLPTLSLDDMKEFERPEQTILAMQFSLDPDSWMDTEWATTQSFFVLLHNELL